MQQERNYYLAFSAFPGVGPTKFKVLLSNFGSAKKSWEALGKDLEKILGKALTPKFEDFRSKFSIEGYTKALEKKGVSFLILKDSEYPQLLKDIKNPPFVLYVKCQDMALRSPFQFDSSSDASAPPVASGDLGVRPAKQGLMKTSPNEKSPRAISNSSFTSEQSSIAVVGTRKITNYGREVTEILVAELVNAGFTIVSGLAMGVDAVAHKTAIDCNGKTIAVLGSGVDFCTPPVNQPLYNSIVSSGGAIVSEFPLSQPPTKGSFPSRNRIIAGLSLAVLVTEGAEDSGALITADYAFKNNRKVFAVPGPITSSLSKGPYKLIEKGAKLVTSAKDILNELKFQVPNNKSQINSKSIPIKSGSKIQNIKTENKEEQRILEILENEPLHFDAIARILKLDPSKVGSILSIMEVKGMVRSLENGLFSIAS